MVYSGGPFLGWVFFMFMMNMKILIKGGGLEGESRWEKGWPEGEEKRAERS